ncbi:hypothetical protein LVD15_16635 [Fulvivirga maritima]|uniref:hypothetical protein n=1 Tax=Fulvivirga maritima TaxID=2904247 RepID=UPI001F2F2272|nr:hypothetical protein [Fulvivirga maritima]UII24927.1 hypothetical protein LVD15_16635 [Fulvivirga maritima]
MLNKIDILLLYSEADNVSMKSGKGWVEDFQSVLEKVIVKLLGKSLTIQKIEVSHITLDDLASAEVLISILSDPFLQNDKNIETLQRFHDLEQSKSYMKLFKVIKSPVNLDSIPDFLKPYPSFPLYDETTTTGDTNWQGFQFIEQQDATWLKLTDLAYEISESLSISESDTSTSISAHSSGKAIYLAETNKELTIQRNIIKRELLKSGYKVYPEFALPKEVDTLKNTVHDQMVGCSVSIHLVGESYGEIPQGSDRSIIDLQNQIAAEKSIKLKDKNLFSRLIWISPNQSEAEDKHKAFVQNIKRDLTAADAEILEIPLEDFKGIIREEFTKSASVEKKNTNAKNISNTKNSIYLIHDKLDADEVAPLKAKLFAEGYELLTPTCEGDIQTQQNLHIHHLIHFDSVIIFQHHVNDQWVKMKLLDLMKAPGVGRKKIAKHKLLVSKKSAEELARFDKYDVNIFDGYTPRGANSIKSIIDSLTEA